MKSFTGITRDSVLKLIILLYYGQMLLPILFNRLPMPFGSYLFYSAALLTAMLVFYPISFFNKNLVWFYAFVAIHLVFRLIVWEARKSGYAFSYSIKDFTQTYLPLYLAILVFWHYVSNDEARSLGRICSVIFVYAFLGILNNLSIFIRYPNAMNVFTGYQASAQHATFIGMLSSLGFLGYGFFNGLTSLLPVMIYMIRYGAKKMQQKWLWVSLILVFLLTLPRTNTTAFLLFAVIFGSAAWFVRKNYQRDLVRILMLMMLVILIPNSFLASIFYRSSEYFPNSKIGIRLYDAGLTIEDPYIDYYQSTEHTGRRLGRIPLLWRSFLSDPLFGGGFFTGHVAWFDMLSIYGLIGFIPWVIFIYQSIRKTSICLPRGFKPYYMLSIMSFVAMGFLKGTGGTHVWSFWFLLLPGSAFIYSSRKSLSDKLKPSSASIQTKGF